MASTQKVWSVGDGVDNPIRSIEVLEDVLCRQRGIRAKDRNRFFMPQYSRDVHNPMLLFDMDRAVDRIYCAVQKNERVLVYGDYDVDGISATAIMVTVLQSIGVTVIPYIPHRADDGYGLSKQVVTEILPEFDLLISVDCGISNQEEISWLRSKRKDVIVVDHHEIPERLPGAIAIVHPRHPQGTYPCPHLSGAGVSWKLTQALLRDQRLPQSEDPDQEKWLLDIVLLGTVGDMMPLVGENRAIVRFGIEVLRHTKRPGLRALIELARLNVNTLTVEDISYRLIPLMNAAGRIDHAQPALDVLLSHHESRARQQAHRLVELNGERQAITRRILREVEQHIDVDAPIVFAADTTWPAGVVGLVAGRLAERLARPAVVIGGNGHLAVGSARAYSGVHMLNALRSAGDHMVRLGGHAQAAGFTLHPDRVHDVEQALHEHFSSVDLEREDVVDGTADALIDHNLISWDVVDLLHRFEPFGEANVRPLFVMKRLPLIHARPVGKSKEHMKFRFAVGEEEVDGIGFGLACENNKGFGRHVDVLASVDVNEFQGSTMLQLKVDDVAPAGQVDIRKKKIEKGKR